jgi:hypothetical protein
LARQCSYTLLPVNLRENLSGNWNSEFRDKTIGNSPTKDSVKKAEIVSLGMSFDHAGEKLKSIGLAKSGI